MCGSMVDIESATAEAKIRRGKKERKKNKLQDKNIMSESATQGGHNKHWQSVNTIYNYNKDTEKVASQIL